MVTGQVPGDPKDEGKVIFAWPWNGAVPLHKDALWLVWALQRLMEGAICHHLREAGLTGRGSKCQMAKVTYTWDTSSPDSSNVDVIVN